MLSEPRMLRMGRATVNRVMYGSAVIGLFGKNRYAEDVRTGLQILPNENSGVCA